MRKLRNGFVSSDNTNTNFYDLREDWVLIEASIAKQYGIRIRHEADMTWNEFCTLVSGLLSDTPLGQVVAIRAESDSERIANFTSEQRRIYNNWKLKQAKTLEEDTDKLESEMDEVVKMLELAFGGGDIIGR